MTSQVEDRLRELGDVLEALARFVFSGLPEDGKPLVGSRAERELDNAQRGPRGHHWGRVPIDTTIAIARIS